MGDTTPAKICHHFYKCFDQILHCSRVANDAFDVGIKTLSADPVHLQEGKPLTVYSNAFLQVLKVDGIRQVIRHYVVADFFVAIRLILHALQEAAHSEVLASAMELINASEIA